MPQPEGSFTQGHFSRNQNMPERYQAALRSGLSFFEIRLLESKKYTQSIYGPFDVRVTEDVDPMTQRWSYRHRWLTGSDAKVTFECVNQKFGSAVAFMVDDPWWRNRVIMIEQKSLSAIAYHVPDDQPVHGAIIMKEIDCLRDVLYEDIPIFHVVTMGNRIAASFDNEKDVKEMLSLKNYSTCRMEIGKTKAKRPWVIDMIKKYSGLEYGWTSCDEFKRRVKAETEDLIRTRGISRKVIGGSGLSPDEVLSAVNQALTPELLTEKIRSTFTASQIKALVRDIEAKEKSEALTPFEGKSAGNNSDENSSKAYDLSIPLDRWTKGAMETKALELGIIIDGLTRQQLLDALKTAKKNGLFDDAQKSDGLKPFVEEDETVEQEMIAT